MENKSEKHYGLISSYIFNRFLYSLSFEDKVAMDLGMDCYNIRSYSKELDALSDEELSKKMDELKKPWWYDTYEEAFCDREHFFEVLYPQYKDSLLEEVAKDKEAYKAFCNSFDAHKPDINKLLSVYLHLQDKELKDILEAHDEKDLLRFINNILSVKL